MRIQKYIMALCMLRCCIISLAANSCLSYTVVTDLNTMTSTVCFDQYNRIADNIPSSIVNESREKVAESLNQTFSMVSEGNYYYNTIGEVCYFQIKIDKKLIANDDSYRVAVPVDGVPDQTRLYDVMHNDQLTASYANPEFVKTSDYRVVLLDGDTYFEVVDNQLRLKANVCGDYTCRYLLESTKFSDFRSNEATLSVSLYEVEPPEEKGELYEVEPPKEKEEPVELDIPLFFTPNGDGVNDEWRVNIDGFGSFDLRIFDRKGRLLVEYANEEVAWDGSYQGTQLPSGDYWYVIYLRDDDQKRVGHVTLLR